MLDYRRTAGLFPRPPDLHQYKEQLLVCGLRLAFSRPYALHIKDQVSVPLHLLSRLSAMNKTTDSFPYSLTSIVLLKQIASRGYARRICILLLFNTMCYYLLQSCRRLHFSKFFVMTKFYLMRYIMFSPIGFDSNGNKQTSGPFFFV